MKRIFEYGQGIAYDRSKEIISQDEKGRSVIKCTCERCGGSGIIPRYMAIDNGNCFKCLGTGYIERSAKLYTKEEVDKKVAKYQATADERYMKQVEKLNESDRAEAGFKGVEILYAVTGNTYNLKEELKLAGAKWNKKLMAWVFAEKPENFDTYEVKYEDLFTEYIPFPKEHPQAIRLMIDDDRLYEVRELIKNGGTEKKEFGEFVGKAGERIELDVKFTRETSYSTNYGTTYIYFFADSKGDILTWKTSKYMDFEANQDLKIKATVKEHTVYNDEKQTSILRVKVL